MTEPTYVQRLVARHDFFDEVINSMTTPEVKLAYMPNSLNGKSPCIVMQSGGTDDVHDLNFKVAQSLKVAQTDFEMRVSILSLYSDGNDPAVYYEEQAADQLDRVADELLAGVRAKRVVAGKWKQLEWRGMSLAFDLRKIGGTLYQHELVIFKMTLY